MDRLRVHLGVDSGVAGRRAPVAPAGDADLAGGLLGGGPDEHGPAAVALAGVHSPLARADHERPTELLPVGSFALGVGDERWIRLPHPLRVVRVRSGAEG